MSQITMDTEYREALASSVVFDRTSAGKLEVSGKDAPSFLHNLSTNDINSLPLGAGCEVYFCDHKAKALFQAIVYHVLQDGRHAFWLDVTPGYADKLLKHLDKHLISEAVELVDLTEQYSQFHLAGPMAKQTLERAIGTAIPDLAEFQHMEGPVGKFGCKIRRDNPLGLSGYDLLCRKEECESVGKTLQDAGAVSGGDSTYETLRVEAGTPIYGVDIDENRFVMEIARALRAVSYAKGCYLGQEPIVMARVRAGFVNRSFLGVKILEGGPLPAGTKLFRDAAEVGLVTSSLMSPRLNAPLALAYIRRGNQDPGLRLEAETSEGRRPVEVLPFPPVEFRP